MILKIFTVYDSKAEAFLQPFLFSRTARKFHKRNLNTSPMRGGIRL